MSPIRPSQQYEAIADHLRTAMREGELNPGDILPSEAQLCESFHSSRGPVRQAMATLRNEGLISSGRGRRSIVLEAAETESFDAILSVTSWLSSHGIEPGSRTLLVARQPAPADIAAKLEIGEGEPVVSLHRLRLGDGEPVLVERQHFRMEYGRHILGMDTDHESINRGLQQAGLNINNISRTLSVIPAPDDDAQLLELEQPSALLQLEMRTFTHAGTPVACMDYRYRPDRISMGMNNTRGNPSPLWVNVHV